MARNVFQVQSTRFIDSIIVDYEHRMKIYSRMKRSLHRMILSPEGGGGPEGALPMSGLAIHCIGAQILSTVVSRRNGVKGVRVLL